MGIKLKFVKRADIHRPDSGLEEPSGLTMSNEGQAFWTVSDDTKTIFKMDLDGNLVEGESFAVDQSGLEGITLDPTGNFLYAVKEEGNIIIKYSLKSKSTVISRRLSDLQGYNKVARHFSVNDINNGMEGITVNTQTENLFLLKESEPGLLLEVTPDLEQLIEFRMLNKKRGFSDNNIKSKKIDYSGICYDSTRDEFWIISDRAKRIYLYNWKEDKVKFDSPLKYKVDGKNKMIKKAEGLVFDPMTDLLYIVSDQESRLYVYKLLDTSHSHVPAN